jgi:protein required for attachment to host cells
MRLPHNALVAVADGRKLLFLRNEGDAVQPVLRKVKVEVKPNPKDSDQKTDASGQASSTQSGPGAPAVAQNGSMHARGGGAQFAPSRGTMGETDFHQLEEDRFAAETAELLKRRAMNGDFEQLIVVAPPRTLGELRKHYHKEVSDRLAGELGKDLTNHPLDEIERILTNAE